MTNSRITAQLGDYVGGALGRALPEEIAERTAMHILDTIAAMVSGSRLAAGDLMIPYVRSLGGTQESTVIGSDLVTTAADAALANGTFAHADETDDTHSPAYVHPGCAVVPAALAIAERNRRSGEDLLRAVSMGYDIAARLSAALGSYSFVDHHHSSHAFGGLFGAAAAAASLHGLDANHATQVFCYATHFASGNNCFVRDHFHVEKGFVHGGMPAQRGVQAASMVAAGFVGSSNALEGMPGLFAAFPETSNPQLAIEKLGTRFEVMRTTIKKWAVSMPIQAALQSLDVLLSQHFLTASEIENIVVDLRAQQAAIVDNSNMPAACLQQQLALRLIDGKVTFASSHDHARMSDPAAASLRARIRVQPRSDDDFERHKRQALVTIRLSDGRTIQHRTLYPIGMPENPMSRQDVVAKAEDLIGPILGPRKSSDLIACVLQLQVMPDVTALRSCLQP